MNKSSTFIKKHVYNLHFHFLAVAAALTVVVFAIYFNLLTKNQSLIKENTFVLAESILQQTSDTAAFLIKNNDMDDLQIVVNSVSKPSHINELVIYDLSGNVIVQSQHARLLKEQNFYHEESLEPLAPKAFVKEIFNEEGKKIGFIRLTLFVNSLQNNSLAFNQSLFLLLIGLTLLACFMGYLLTISRRENNSLTETALSSRY